MELSGTVDLVVFHEEGGLSALVIPDALWVRAETSVGSPRGAFVAHASVGL